MAEKKHSAFALLDILTTYSDEDHVLTTKQLQQHLHNKYDLDLERRTLYSNLDILQQFGFKISRYEDNGKGYFLEERQFDKGEILLLCNAIHASHFISSKQSEQLIGKLLKTQSRYQSEEFSDAVYLPNPQKTPNDELMYNIGMISEAIRDGKMIQFTYMKYNRDRKLVPRRKEPYIVEPRYIVYSDSRGYVIVTSPNHEGFIHYRLDRISKAFLLEGQVPPLKDNKDAYEYARNKLFMYAGQTGYVQFRCHERIMDQMIDIFGTELFIMPQDDEHFTIQVSTSETGALFLAQQFMDSLEIMQPKPLRDKFITSLQNKLKEYTEK